MKRTKRYVLTPEGRVVILLLLVEEHGTNMPQHLLSFTPATGFLAHGGASECLDFVQLEAFTALHRSRSVCGLMLSPFDRPLNDL